MPDNGNVRCRRRARVHAGQVGLLMLALAFRASFAGPAPVLEGSPAGAPRYAHGYVGQFADTAFNRIIRFTADFDSSWVGVVGAGQTLWRHGPVQIDGEVHAAQHWGMQRHQELNAGLMLRWSRFPWERHLRTSLAFGSGISHASQSPPVERPAGEWASRTVKLMLLEVTAAPAGSSSSEWSTFVRVHHRSTVFGTFGEGHGSNFIAVGLRRHF